MTSVNLRIAQPLTKHFVVDEPDTSPKFYTNADLSVLVTDNTPNVTKLGSSYIVKESEAATVLDAFAATGHSLSNHRTLKDMGKEVRIGTTTEASLVVLRLVQAPGPVANNGTPNNYDTDGTAYVVVENKVDDPAVTNTNLNVYVSRV